MSWQESYGKKLVKAPEALKHIKNNSRVVAAHALAEPSYLLDEMVVMKEQFRNIEIIHMASRGSGAYCNPGMEPYFHHNSFFTGITTTEPVAEGRADFTPVYFSEIPKLFRTKLPVDVALVMVTPPDENGKVSLGVSVDYSMAAVECADLVIAQVNAQMPYTLGNSRLSVDQIDYFVEHSAPIIEVPVRPLDEISKQIGKNCAELISDGDTLQLGIGTIPDAVLASLKHKKDLGIHSEMISDGVVDLYEAGVITGKRKPDHKDKMVVSFLMGSKKLYDFANQNEEVELYPVDYTNNPVVIAMQDHMVSINTCVQIDLMGQVAAETIGLKQISGVGGQVDFVRGAAMAEHGKAIMALPSTAKGGKISKIVSFLDQGAAVTTNRMDVDYVVTEYGIADLKGHTLRERARALIEVAAPKFRQELMEEYERRFFSKY